MGALTTTTPSTPALVLFGRDQAGKPHASWFDVASVELATKAAGLMSMRAVPVESDELRELVANLPRGRLFSSGRALTPFVKGKLYERLVELTRDMLGLESGPAADSNETSEASDGAALESGGAAEGDAAPRTDGEPTAGEAAAPTTPAVTGVSSTPAKASASTVAAANAAKSSTSVAAKPSPRPSRIEEIGPGSTVLATTGAAEGWYEARVIGTNGSTFTLKWIDYGEPSFVRRGNELAFLPRLPD